MKMTSIYTNSFWALLLLIQVILLYKQPIILFIFLLIYNGIILYFEKNKVLYKVFIFSAIFGSIAEMISIFYGVWSYSVASELLGIPYWLFFVWGYAGVYLYKVGLHFNKK